MNVDLKLLGEKLHMKNFLGKLMAREEPEDLPWPEDN